MNSALSLSRTFVMFSRFGAPRFPFFSPLSWKNPFRLLYCRRQSSSSSFPVPQFLDLRPSANCQLTFLIGSLIISLFISSKYKKCGLPVSFSLSPSQRGQWPVNYVHIFAVICPRVLFWIWNFQSCHIMQSFATRKSSRKKEDGGGAIWMWNYVEGISLFNYTPTFLFSLRNREKREMTS